MDRADTNYFRCAADAERIERDIRLAKWRAIGEALAVCAMLVAVAALMALWCRATPPQSSAINDLDAEAEWCEDCEEALP